MKEHYEISEHQQQGEAYNWAINRRKWLQLALLGSAAVSLPWVTSCEAENGENEPNLDGKGLFTKVEMKDIYTLQNFLLPESDNGPSAAQMNAHQYFVWFLNDEHLPKSEKDYFSGKTLQFIDLCKKQRGSSFHQLSIIEQENFILKNISEGWFESYLSRMITVVFEATLLDPIYGGNTEEAGWNWLEHIPGIPRPNTDTKYPDILVKIKPNLT